MLELAAPAAAPCMTRSGPGGRNWTPSSVPLFHSHPCGLAAGLAIENDYEAELAAQ